MQATRSWEGGNEQRCDRPLWQRAPRYPGGQTQRPDAGWQEAPFIQSHCSWHSGPWRPGGQAEDEGDVPRDLKTTFMVLKCSHWIIDRVWTRGEPWHLKRRSQSGCTVLCFFSTLIDNDSICFATSLIRSASYVSLCVFISSHHVHTHVHSSLSHTDTSPSLCHTCRYFDSYTSADSWHQTCPQDILRDNPIKQESKKKNNQPHNITVVYMFGRSYNNRLDCIEKPAL